MQSGAGKQRLGAGLVAWAVLTTGWGWGLQENIAVTHQSST